MAIATVVIVANALQLSEIAARLTTATLAGAVLGLNRNLHGKAAGLRTHALVALGAALVTAAAGTADPAGATRVMQGVITGIGFIGAGVILHPSPPAVQREVPTPPGASADQTEQRHRPQRKGAVRGLTTAANVWVAAALGLAAGLGAWTLVLLGTLLTLAILIGGGRVENSVRRRLLGRLRRRRALQHHHRTRDEVRVRERHVHPHDA